MITRLLVVAAALLVSRTAASADGFLGFRLLDLDGSYVRWGGTGADPAAQPVRVSYAFVNGPTRPTDAHNCRAMTPVDNLIGRSRIAEPVFRAEVREAFRMWENVAHIRFEYSQDAATADILIGAQSMPFGRAFTDVSYAVPPTGEKAGEKLDPSTRRISRSLICLNPMTPWKVGFDGDVSVYDLRYTIAHEIGHAIGLNHPSAAGQLMSYRYDERVRDLQPGDIAGAVALYGEPRPAVDTSAATNGGELTKTGAAKPEKGVDQRPTPFSVSRPHQDTVSN